MLLHIQTRQTWTQSNLSPRLACCYPCQTITHIYAPLWTLFLVSSHTSAGQYVFVPAATEYFPQTDRLSGVAVIHGCCFVCLRPWQWCRLIWLSPAHKITTTTIGLPVSTSFNPSPSFYNHLLHAPPIYCLSSLAIPVPRKFMNMFSLTQF